MWQPNANTPMVQTSVRGYVLRDMQSTGNTHKEEEKAKLISTGKQCNQMKSRCIVQIYLRKSV